MAVDRFAGRHGGTLSAVDVPIGDGYPATAASNFDVTFSGTYTAGIVLGSPAQNPFTIAASGYVTNKSTANYSAAVLGTSGFAWTLTNLGTVKSGAGILEDAVVLDSGGLIVNGQSTGTAASSALIAGNLVAADIFGTLGTVENFGTITDHPPGANKGGGVHIARGGTVENGNNQIGGALISADRFAIYMGGNGGTQYSGASGTVVNYGTIVSTGTGGTYEAVVLTQGGSVANHGLIQSASCDAVSISGAAGTVVNDGTVIGSAAGGTLTAVVLNSGGLVTNSGTITDMAGNGVSFGSSSTAGTLVNSGLINSSLANGVVINSPAGVVQNSGTILAAGPLRTVGTTTVYPNGIVLNAGGTVLNGESGSGTGLISGGWNGVFIANGFGSVVNFGTIEATGTTLSPKGFHSNPIVIGTGVVINGAPGATGALITGYEKAIYIGGRNGVATAGNVGTVVNYGAISGTGTGTVAASAIFLVAGGIVTNAGTIASAGSNGISIGTTSFASAGTVVNSGTILASSGFRVLGTVSVYPDGIVLNSGGSVTNTAGGLIEAGWAGVSAGFARATVINYGTIESTDTVLANGSLSGPGIVLSGGGRIVNAAGALIQGYSGISIGGSKGVATAGHTGTVLNYGTIVSTRSTVAAGSTLVGSDVGLAAGGLVVNGAGSATGALIDATYGLGLYFGGTGGIATPGAAGTAVNYGTIESGAHSGVKMVSGGTVTNFGVIAGGTEGFGVSFVGTAGTVTNFGTINASSGTITSGTSTSLGAGVYLGNGGTVVNQAGGVIQGALLGVELLGSAGATLVNYGEIVGSSGTAVMLGSGADLVVIEPGAIFQGAIAGFGPGDTLDFAQVTATRSAFAYGTLTLYNGRSVVGQVSLPGSFTIQNFVLAPDGNGGTDVQFRYITGTYTSTVVVAYTAPTTVEATGVVTVAQGDAIVNQTGSAATLSNYGTIAATGSGGTGVYLNAGGTVSNSAAIAGYVAGVAISGAAGTLVNAGTIAATGTAGVGVILGAAAAAARASATAYYSVTAANYGTISGYTGVSAGGGNDTLSNAGVIIGYGGTAVMLAGGYDRLIVNQTGVFYGIANGGGGNSVLELAGPANAGGTGGAQYIGTLAGIGSSFVNFGTLLVDPGTNWELAGYGGSYQFVNDGTIIIANDIATTGDVMVFGSVGEDSGDKGAIILSAGGIADFTGPVAKGQTVMFADAYGDLQLGDAQAFAARIEGFRAGDVIDLAGVAADKYTYAKGKLTVREGQGTVGVLLISGPYGKHDFQLAPDAYGGTYIMLSGSAAGRAPPGLWAARG